jgi:hypothetical protein
MSHHKLSFDAACKACQATGLHVGIAERDGAAVLCHTCKGTGKQIIVVEYDDFEGRKERPEVERVFQVNPGICICKEKGRFTLDEFGGMSYEDWESGKTFPPGSEKPKVYLPGLVVSIRRLREKAGMERMRLGFIQYFGSKDKCWERWDAENSEKEGSA